MKSENCQCCKGKGYVWAKLKNLGTREIEEHAAPCDHPTCNNGKVGQRLEKDCLRSWKSYLTNN